VLAAALFLAEYCPGVLRALDSAARAQVPVQLQNATAVHGPFVPGP
jgi:hypothetical protein